MAASRPQISHSRRETRPRHQGSHPQGGQHRGYLLSAHAPAYRHAGKVLVLLRQTRPECGEIRDETRCRIWAADVDTLLAWSKRIIGAKCIEDVAH